MGIMAILNRSRQLPNQCLTQINNVILLVYYDEKQVTCESAMRNGHRGSAITSNKQLTRPQSGHGPRAAQLV